MELKDYQKRCLNEVKRYLETPLVPVTSKTCIVLKN
jgi:hypothetical protein